MICKIKIKLKNINWIFLLGNQKIFYKTEHTHYLVKMFYIP